VGQYRSLTVRRGAKASQESLFEGEHVITKNRVSVTQRTDRHLLLSLYDQAAQVLMLRVDLLGAVDGHKIVEHDHPALVAAAAFFVPLAKYYANNGVSKADLKGYRDAELEKLGKKVGQKRDRPEPEAPKKGEYDKTEVAATKAATKASKVASGSTNSTNSSNSGSATAPPAPATTAAHQHQQQHAACLRRRSARSQLPTTTPRARRQPTTP
jgi:hypothetical protein